MVMASRNAGILEKNSVLNAGKLLETAFHIAYEGGRFVTLTCFKEINGRYILSYHFDKAMEIISYKIRIHENDKIPSISVIFPSALLVENEAAKKYGLEFIFLYSKGYYGNSLSKLEDFKSLAHKYKMHSLKGEEWKLLFGPNHPALSEPLELNLLMQGETIVEAEPVTGYVHRDVEGMLIGKSVNDALAFVERICGRCSISHSLAYCQGIEGLYEIEIPERAKYLRIIWAELERVYHHLSLVAHAADVLGSDILYMKAYKNMEKISNIFYKNNGKKYITGMNIIGGTKINIDRDTEVEIIVILNELAEEVKSIKHKFFSDNIIRKRLRGVGALGKDYASAAGIVGPAARASGIAYDTRMTGYCKYDSLDFKPVILKEGDCYARVKLVFDEIFQSVDLIEQAIDKMPKGEVYTDINYTSAGETVSRVEQPGGELVYCIKAGAKGFIENISIKTASMSNFGMFIESLKGDGIDNVPVVLDSFGICIACMEK